MEKVVGEDNKRTPQIARRRGSVIRGLMPGGYSRVIGELISEQNEKRSARNLRIDCVARLDPMIILGFEQKFSDHAS